LERPVPIGAGRCRWVTKRDTATLCVMYPQPDTGMSDCLVVTKKRQTLPERADFILRMLSHSTVHSDAEARCFCFREICRMRCGIRWSASRCVLPVRLTALQASRPIPLNGSTSLGGLKVHPDRPRFLPTAETRLLEIVLERAGRDVD